MARAESARSVSRKSSAARPNSNECSSATARLNAGAAALAQVVSKWIVPSRSAAPP
jgi:hypothetical protein